MKEVVAAYENIRARFYALASGLDIDAAIDLDIERGQRFGSEALLCDDPAFPNGIVVAICARQPDLFENFRHELLSSEPRTDGHQENQVALIEILWDHGERSFRAECKTGFLSAFPDEGKGVLDILCRFKMKRDTVGSFPDEALDIIEWIVDHEMDVEKKPSSSIDRSQCSGSQGEIGNEMAIHDIDMDGIGACLFDSLCLVGKTAEITGENRRVDLDLVVFHSQ